MNLGSCAMKYSTTIERRLRTGEFYTPLECARLGFYYLQRILDFQSSGLRLWDMAAGTGNLETVLPPEFLSRCYISTLLDDDADRCQKKFPSATAFQYDYLNDDQSKLPSKLVSELNDPTLEWLIFINPPYAMANNFERRADRVDKSSVSMTRIRQLMTADGLGAVSRELYAQFLYRIDRDFKGRRSTLAMFSKLNYINATNDQKLRDKIFDYEFKGGFLIPSKIFADTKGNFPVGFMMWSVDGGRRLSEQEIIADVFDENLNPIGTKKIISAPRGELLNAWIKRPRAKKKIPAVVERLDDRIAQQGSEGSNCRRIFGLVDVQRQ